MIPSRLALVLLGVFGLLAILGFVNPVFGWAALAADAFLIVLVLVDAWLARGAHLEARRTLPSPVHQGEDTRLSIRLENHARRTLQVRGREVLAPQLTADPLAFEAAIPRSSRLVKDFELVPRLRGVAELAPLALRILGPLGLAWSERRVATGESTRVFPRTHLEGEAGLLVRQAMEKRLGVNPLVSRGISHEIYGVREYLPGDEYRMIHWKAAARMHRPVTRETTWEQHQSVVVLLDCGRPMASLAGSYAKLDHALSAVLALLRVIVAQQDAATLVLFSKEVRQVVRVDRRTRSFASVFERVYETQADLDEPDYARVAAWCAREVPRRSLALVCTSVIDMVGAERLSRALRGLAARHRPLLVNLADPGLHEMATGMPSEPVESFAKASALALVAANRELSTRLRGHGIEVVSVPASRLGIGVIQGYLDFKARRSA